MNNLGVSYRPKNKPKSKAICVFKMQRTIPGAWNSQLQAL